MMRMESTVAMPGQPTEYPARCHCGAVQARYQTSLAPAAWSIRACQCSFCKAHAALSTSDPNGRLTFMAVDPTSLHRYSFGTRSAAFLICRNCGVYIGARMESEKGHFGILNIRALSPVPTSLPEPAARDYGNEDVGTRRSRREVLWTPLTPDSA